MTKPRVGIALPLVSLKAKPLVALASTLCTTDADMALLVTEGAYIPYNRILLVGLAQEQGCSHMFFMDHDMVFAADTLTKLLAHDKDIVGTAYNMRSLPLTTTVILMDKNGEKTLKDDLPKELFRCEALGCGCLLVRTEIFEKIERPWFAIKIDPKDNELKISEDIWFCNQARKAGYDIWCDPTLPIGHIGEAIY